MIGLTNSTSHAVKDIVNIISQNGQNQLSNLGRYLTNDSVDTTSTLSLSFVSSSDASKSMLSSAVHSTGEYKAIVESTFSDYISFIHIGQTEDIVFGQSFAYVTEGNKYYISFNVLTNDPSQVGGVQISNFMIINLTTLFGESYEIDTVDHFATLLDKPFYAYHDPEVKPIRIFSDVVVSEWITLSDESEDAFDRYMYSKGFTYKGIFGIDNVDSTMCPTVTFDYATANFSNICTMAICNDDGVCIYSPTEISGLTAMTIVLSKEV